MKAARAKQKVSFRQRKLVPHQREGCRGLGRGTPPGTLPVAALPVGHKSQTSVQGQGESQTSVQDKNVEQRNSCQSSGQIQTSTHACSQILKLLPKLGRCNFGPRWTIAEVTLVVRLQNRIRVNNTRDTLLLKSTRTRRCMNRRAHDLPANFSIPRVDRCLHRRNFSVASWTAARCSCRLVKQHFSRSPHS